MIGCWYLSKGRNWTIIYLHLHLHLHHLIFKESEIISLRPSSCFRILLWFCESLAKLIIIPPTKIQVYFSYLYLQYIYIYIYQMGRNYFVKGQTLLSYFSIIYSNTLIYIAYILYYLVLKNKFYTGSKFITNHSQLTKLFCLNYYKQGKGTDSCFLLLFK